MNTSICDAINRRLILKFVYRGLSRIVEPHCHGTGRANNEVLRAFQIGGESESGRAIGWKLFDVDQISGLVASSEVFTGTRPGYNPADSHMTSICCAV
jgi:hypothetical protein